MLQKPIYAKGEKLEKFVSQKVHQSYKPALLISSKVLRRRELGQIDVACFKANKLYLIECKEGKERIDPWQLKRLRKSLRFLKVLFDCEGHLILACAKPQSKKVQFAKVS